MELRAPKAARCGEGRTWDVWWHAEDGAAFVNRADATPCAFSLEITEGTLTGAFGWVGLAEEGGARRVDAEDGHFACEVGAS